jgi:hypothetical protein
VRRTRITVLRRPVALHHRIAAYGAGRQRAADLAEIGLLIELQNDDGAAFEIDPLLQSAGHDHAEPGQDHDQREHHRVPAPPDEVEVAVVQESHGAPRC